MYQSVQTCMSLRVSGEDRGSREEGRACDSTSWRCPKISLC